MLFILRSPLPFPEKIGSECLVSAAVEVSYAIKYEFHVSNLSWVHLYVPSSRVRLLVIL